MARKVYAMSLTSTWIYEYPDQSSRFVGDVGNGTLLFPGSLQTAGRFWDSTGGGRHDCSQAVSFEKDQTVVANKNTIDITGRANLHTKPESGI